MFVIIDIAFIVVVSLSGFIIYMVAKEIDL
jgi:hypothetical protein